MGVPRRSVEFRGDLGVGSLQPHPRIFRCMLMPWSVLFSVLEALSVLVNNPELGQPLRIELADLMTQNPEVFNRKAEEFTREFGEDRPS